MPLDEILALAWEFRNEDPHHLALQKPSRLGVPMQQVAAQVKAWQKIKQKVPEWYRADLWFPLAISLEQASSEPTARFKATISSGKKMADLTGGLGIDAYFFAQKFEEVVVVEQQELLANALKHNFARLGLSNVRVVHQDAADFLAKTIERFDLVYLDPARRGSSGQKLYRLEDCSPNILEIKPLAFQKTDKILLKASPMLDIRQASQSLGNVSEVWALAYQGECREVLYQIERISAVDGAASCQPISVHALDLSATDPVPFTFSWEEEQAASPIYSPPLKFLYEPNPAIMKAGAFRAFAQRYGLHKLHPNTHLYTSETPQNVPGRRFAVLATARYDRNAVQSLVPAEQANISCRNFPDSPEQVRRRLRLADGGDLYLFATTISPDQKTIIIAYKQINE